MVSTRVVRLRQRGVRPPSDGTTSAEREGTVLAVLNALKCLQPGRAKDGSIGHGKSRLKKGKSFHTNKLKIASHLPHTLKNMDA